MSENKIMKVLVACEFSGIVRDAFRAKGHDAWSCDILPCNADSFYKIYHIQADVLNIIESKEHDVPLWDLMIACPPCTRICNSGVRWLKERNLWAELDKACEFFNRLKEANIPRICIENSIPHKYAVAKIGKYDQLIQPWQFGHGETKATCLWLKNLPKLQPINIVEGREARIHKMPPSKDRGKLRSITYPGIADAMAEQWG